jgi:hypothetical protein
MLEKICCHQQQLLCLPLPNLAPPLGVRRIPPLSFSASLFFLNGSFVPLASSFISVHQRFISVPTTCSTAFSGVTSLPNSPPFIVPSH